MFVLRKSLDKKEGSAKANVNEPLGKGGTAK
jgi:hypothetical protein